jgi:hypothetical protein
MMRCNPSVSPSLCLSVPLSLCSAVYYFPPPILNLIPAEKFKR